MKKIFVAAILLFASFWVIAQDNFTKGEELFMRNNPREALIYLQNAINENPGNVKSYLYLGIIYEQMGRSDEAVSVYREVLFRAGDMTANVATNLGNVYFQKAVFYRICIH